MTKTGLILAAYVVTDGCTLSFGTFLVIEQGSTLGQDYKEKHKLDSKQI